ncbi:hypothetical protein OCO_30810 [Mycobacterium intracellulare MOTT-02]|uniref:Uncharacterized protein n=1 Tax=Mycobacterium intracellulare 1956 TaxID=1299331 RepID=X8CGT0_MYCIT|nr:hypothetical protein OCO_30810 [Mycobacterium intracellulare MOTT-02]EUA32325.1 hypothetical protein I548_1099 [Mycobacterium intracellulare]EUA55031.1 hypothetical protein I550_3182 [Mycobacterium intracellulare 1956]
MLGASGRAPGSLGRRKPRPTIWCCARLTATVGHADTLRWRLSLGGGHKTCRLAERRKWRM